MARARRAHPRRDRRLPHALRRRRNKKYVADREDLRQLAVRPVSAHAADAGHPAEARSPASCANRGGDRQRRGTTSVQLLPTPPVVISEAPDTETLVNAANLYPLLIESDEVAAAQPAPGGCRIEATGVFASTNTFGVFKASPVPVVAVKSTCDDQAQRDPDVAEPRRRPSEVDRPAAGQGPGSRASSGCSSRSSRRRPSTTTIGGPSAGLPVFVGVVVFLLFCGLAILLDRPPPGRTRTRIERTRGAAAAAAPEPELVAVSASAVELGPSGLGRRADGDSQRGRASRGAARSPAGAGRLAGSDQELPAAGQPAVLARAVPAR